MSDPPGIAHPRRRWWFGAAAVIATLVVLLSIGALPWFYPSSTLLYKFGRDKDYLLIGKSIGLAAGALLLVQLTLVARWRLLERMISQNRLIKLHRWVGYTLAAAATLHPLLVFAPEDIGSIPPSGEYWPEMIGAALLVGLLLTAVITGNREFLGLPHQLWKLGHRLFAGGLGALFAVHVLFVSDSYASGPPRYAIIGLMAAFGATWLRIAMRPSRRGHPYRVSAVRPAGKDAITLEMQPIGRSMSHWPGQFAYLRFRNSALTPEEHPFTIASSPGMPGRLAFTIRCAGDWTSRLNHARQGDRVYVEGPYGLFTPQAFKGTQRLVLIAGGVGITPMLSILRWLAEKEDDRRLVLIWSNRTRADVVHAEELPHLMRRLSGLSANFVFTREKDDKPENGRLNRTRLQSLLGPYQPETLILLCGPFGFMQQIRKNLKTLGYPGRSIKTEAFRM